ncbi:MAG: helix-turn-helix domain-containing protein, partial [Hyphomicrobium sp.]
MAATNSLKGILDQLGLKQTELARLLDVSSRTVSLWATGETALPGPVAAYLRVVRSRPDVLHLELKRLEGR